jgi:hypothetical protein|tara:strand:+ start:492 stop:881 length:390 start_codon:yes stop_codon:yes gene_type:complete
MQTKNNIDKRLEGKSDLTAAAKLADLEKQSFDLEQSIIDTIKEDFEKQDKYKNFLDFLKSKDDDYFKRIELKEGGRVYTLSDYRKSKEPKVKEINLSSLFEHARTIASLSDAEREVVNDLLRKTLGKDK